MSLSLDNLFDSYMWESEFVTKARPETLLGYKLAFTVFMKLNPGITVEQLSPTIIAGFFRTLQERKRIVGRDSIKCGIKNSTVAGYKGKLIGFFNWLTLRKHISSNPFKELKFPTPVYEDAKYLKKLEVEKIIAAIHVSPDESILMFKRNVVLFYLLLYCGLRKEEVMSLHVNDIDFGRKLLTVRKESSKSGKTRQVPLHSTTIMHLKDYLKQRIEYTTPYLIVSKIRDDRLTYDGLKHLVERIRERSGVKFHLHQFRHTFAVNFLRTSQDVASLRQLMGHKDIRMTMVYLRCISVDEIRKDIEAMSIENFMS